MIHFIKKQSKAPGKSAEEPLCATVYTFLPNIGIIFWIIQVIPELRTFEVV